MTLERMLGEFFHLSDIFFNLDKKISSALSSVRTLSSFTTQIFWKQEHPSKLTQRSTWPTQAKLSRYEIKHGDPEKPIETSTELASQ